MLANTACGIGDDQGVDAELVHDSYRQGDLLHAVAFVIMKTALHGHHRFAGKRAAHQLARMEFHRRFWKVRDGVVGKNLPLGYFLRQGT